MCVLSSSILGDQGRTLPATPGPRRLHARCRPRPDLVHYSRTRTVDVLQSYFISSKVTVSERHGSHHAVYSAMDPVTVSVTRRPTAPTRLS